MRYQINIYYILSVFFGRGGQRTFIKKLVFYNKLYICNRLIPILFVRSVFGAVNYINYSLSLRTVCTGFCDVLGFLMYL